MHPLGMDSADMIFIVVAALAMVGLVTMAGAAIAIIKDKWTGE